ncbi:MAG: ATP-binding protein [Candidatus Poribacteria bacterium]|nr:ATP-binding protein [Candidatus Poribacteria bacterium]
MLDLAEREVILIIPMYPNMELAAAQTASILAEIMNFEENHIDEIQFAVIETCINAFEHSKRKDKPVVIKFIMKDDALELKITDCGVGFRLDQVKSSDRDGAVSKGLRKRGWGLEIIRHMMDEVNVESSDKGTTITMTKKKVSSK